ncbi:HAMP domain-containing histidine kinase [bacterium]|nr:HAMP domain-containing histidine kinase [bacterium]MBU1957951.1 HAMP domain-containing histidine kinase [bacterium]
MSLIKEEKRTLLQFLLLYLSSSFILFAIIAYLFYENEYRFFYDNTRTQMQMDASRLSSKIIHAHMSGSKFSLDWVVNNFTDRIGFYDAQNQPIISNIKEKIDFSKQLYQEGNKMILVDKSTFGHLGVASIVIEKNGVATFVKNLQHQILLFLLFIYCILAIVGYFLAKLFIKPIQMKRIQLDNFIKDSTHELNTPVTALMLSVNAPHLERPKNIERIKLSATRISDIHKDLTYLMLDSESTKPKELNELFLNDVIKEELSYLSLLAEKKKIQLTVHYEDEIHFKIDKESFVRLIHNLISNAIKYNTVGGAIDVVIKENTITIKDTGVGIPKEHQSEIYERFYRATHQVGGFGLGLNIVYKVCKAYSIGIDFESKVGEGTIFTLTF